MFVMPDLKEKFGGASLNDHWPPLISRWKIGVHSTFWFFLGSLNPTFENFVHMRNREIVLYAYVYIIVARLTAPDLLSALIYRAASIPPKYRTLIMCKLMSTLTPLYRIPDTRAFWTLPPNYAVYLYYTVYQGMTVCCLPARRSGCVGQQDLTISVYEEQTAVLTLAAAAAVSQPVVLSR